jgi:hypothetical protein
MEQMGVRRSFKRAAKAKAEVDSPAICGLCHCRLGPYNYCQKKENNFNSIFATEIMCKDIFILVPFNEIVNAHCYASTTSLIH